jgi:hypothetical protein
VSYNLSQLGWKAFQDLACAVAAEALQRPVQTFLGSKDGGRDGFGEREPGNLHIKVQIDEMSART